MRIVITLKGDVLCLHLDGSVEDKTTIQNYIEQMPDVAYVTMYQDVNAVSFPLVIST